MLSALLLGASDLHSAWQNPLNAGEIAIASTLALAERATNAITLPFGDSTIDARSITSGVTSQPSHALSTQILLVELREQKKKTTDQAPRLAEVFVFDYQRGATELHLIDVQSNQLISSTDVDSVHLPLVSAEINHTRALVWSNPDIQKRLAEEMIAQGVSTLTARGEPDFSSLQTKVSIWVPANQRQVGESQCDRQRCALVSIFTTDNYNFSVEPVINLMNGHLYMHLIQ